LIERRKQATRQEMLEVGVNHPVKSEY
jgi:hypothetical protein